MEPIRIAIIGGGPGGLMTSYLLEQRATSPCSITLYEAGERLGGKIVTRRFSHTGDRYEAGAAELYDYSQLGPDPLRELVAALGLSTRPMQGSTVVMQDRILRNEADIRSAFGEATLQALQKFKRQARNAISPAEYYESDWQQDNDDPLAKHTFRALINRIPVEPARRYIEVAVHSDLACEPELTSAMYGLQNYLMDEPEYMRLYTIDGGIARLPQELARHIKAKVKFNQPVVRVERSLADKYRVYSRSQGNTSSEDYDYVVVALPNNWIPAIDWAGATLHEAMRKHHQHYNHPAHYLRVSLLFEKPFWREQLSGSYFMLDAFGGCCVYDESSRNEKTPHGVLGWLLAGEAALNLSNFEDSVLFDKMIESLPQSLKPRREWFLEGKVHRWVGSVNGLPGGYPAHEPDSRHQPEPLEHPGLFVVGDYLFDSTLNGVLDSADTAVEWILESIEDEKPLALAPPIYTDSNPNNTPEIGERFGATALFPSLPQN